MTIYYVRLEFPGIKLTEQLADHAMTYLADFHPSVAQTPTKAISIRLALPAENAKIAIWTAAPIAALALTPDTERSEGLAPTFAEAMTEEEFNAREGYDTIPELIGSVEAAELLNVSPQRIRQMIDEGKFRSAQRVGERSYVLARSEVEARTKRDQ